jgi:selenocysteine-specific elongation factor
VVQERGAVALEDLVALTGTDHPHGEVRLRSYVADANWLEQTLSRIEAILKDFHEQEPLAKGMTSDDARRAAGLHDARLFGEIVEHAPGRLAHDGPLLRLASHAVRFSPEQEAARAKVLGAASGFAPPGFAELQRAHGGKLLAALVDCGDLVKLSSDMVFSRASIEDAKRILSDAVAAEGPLTASRIRELLGTSRKYAIPLLEYLDATGFTRRDGDVRTVR